MPRDSRLQGVTLVELMVAITIALALVAVMLSVTQSTLRLWQRAQAVFTSDTEAKLVLDMLERDLHAAVYRDNGATWLAVDVISASATLTNHGWRTVGIIKPAASESLRLDPPPIGSIPASVAETRFGLSGAWLRFITTNV
ncbi:MAG TPA: prepilin-type N-terminal cleavage/methylation domain-containing protein, partial [Opitutus sp.]|nr:prepilin-type N-terminal cleavage/methylation domain-containing protein [Opitutus sp.]